MMTPEEISQAIVNCQEFKTNSHPDISADYIKPHQLFVQKNGIAEYLMPDYRYGFFCILRNEEAIYNQRVKESSSSSILGRVFVCLN